MKDVLRLDAEVGRTNVWCEVLQVRTFSHKFCMLQTNLFKKNYTDLPNVTLDKSV